MEKDNVNILNIDLSQYLEEIEKLRAQLEGLSKDSAEYAKATQDIKNKQLELTQQILQEAQAFKGLKEATELNNVLMASSRLEADEYAESINGIKQHIKDLETIANSMELGTEEYAKVTAQAKNLKDALKDLKGDTAEARLAMDNYANTLNGMRAKLSDMKAVMGNMEMGSDAFKEMAKDAKALNDEISKCEQSYGVFSRNVGNYANSFKEAFSDMSLSVENVAQKTEDITNGFKKATNAASKFVDYMRKDFLKNVVGYIKNAANGIKNFGTNFKNAYAEATKGGKGVMNSFKGITAGIKASTSAVMGFNTAMIPIIASVAAIAAGVALLLAGFAAVKMAIDEDEESTRQWNEAMADVNYYWDMLKNLMVEFGQGLLKVVIPAIKTCADFAINLMNNIKLGLAYLNEFLGNDEYAAQLREEVANSEKMRDIYQEIAKKENELTDMKRKHKQEEAELDRKIAEAREKFNDKEKYSAKERQEAEKELTRLEKEKNQLLTDELKLQDEILQLKSKTGYNNKQTNDELAASNAALANQKAKEDEIDANSAKRRQKVNAEARAQRKEELQATIKYYETVEKNNKKSSDEYKKAHKEKLRLQFELRKQEIEDAKYSAEIKEKLIKELKKEIEKEKIVFEFDTEDLDTRYKDLIQQFKDMPELSQESFSKMYEITEKYQKKFTDSMKTVAENAIPKINIEETFFKDIEAALKDMSQNYIPLTLNKLKDYMKTVGKEMSEDQINLIKQTAAYLSTSEENVLKTLHSFNAELESIKNNKALTKLNNELKAINQSIIILESSYRTVMHAFETEDFTDDVVKYFKDGKFSLQGYLTELNRYTHVTLAQVDVLKGHKDILKDVGKVQEQRVSDNQKEIKTLEDKLVLDKDNIKLLTQYNQAIKNAEKYNNDYIETVQQIADYEEAIQKIESISINKLFKFDEKDSEEIEKELAKLFKKVNPDNVVDSDYFIPLVEQTKTRIQTLFSDIYKGIIPNDSQSIEQAVIDLRQNIRTSLESIAKDLKIDVTEEHINTLIKQFIPSSDDFKKRATEAKNEVETITQDIFRSEMKWYDEGNKKILQAEQKVLQARKQLEIEHKKIIRDETVEDRQQRIYEATVKYEQAILESDRTFFDERRKQYEENSKSDFLSPEHAEYVFNEQKEVLKQTYNEQLNMLKTQLDNELITEEEYEQRKLELKNQYQEVRKQLDNAQKEAERQSWDETNDPIKQEERRIENEKQILEEWYQKKLAEYANNEEMLLQIQEEYARRSMKITNDVAQNEENKLKRRMSITQQWASATGKLFGQVAQYMEQDIEDKKKKGEATEEEMHKEFELMKAFQISAAIIDTLAGALGIYMSYLSAPGLPWVNQALGWTSMGLALTSGFLQVQQIESTRFGDSNTSAAGGMSQIAATPVSYSNVNVNPLLDQNADLGSYSNLSVNATDNEENEQRVYILESDIQTSNARVSMRQARTSF